VQEASDCCAWPVAVPTRILAAVRSTLVTGAPVLKYQPLSPELTMSVSRRAFSVAVLALARLRAARRRFHLAFHLASEVVTRRAGCRGRTGADTWMFGTGGGD